MSISNKGEKVQSHVLVDDEILASDDPVVEVFQRVGLTPKTGEFAQSAQAVVDMIEQTSKGKSIGNADFNLKMRYVREITAAISEKLESDDAENSSDLEAALKILRDYLAKVFS